MVKLKAHQPFEFLRSELEALKVPIELSDSNANIILEEISYALSPPVHEQKNPCYGAIISDGFAERGDDVFDYIFDVEDTTIPSFRIYADGNYSFIFRTNNISSIVSLVPGFPATDEIKAINILQNFKNGIIIQRLKSGTLRIVNQERIIEHKERRWLSKITSQYYYALVQAYVIANSVQTIEHLANELLDFCLHWLSPLKIGATIVWLFENMSGEINRGLSKGEIVPAMTLSRVTYPMLLSALSQLDRALVVDRNGTVKKIGVTLTSSIESEKEIPESGGTRHTTAKRFSYDNPKSLVFVISEDGPVSVFGAGNTLVKSSMDIFAK